MRKHHKLVLLSMALALVAIGGSTVFALPNQASVHAQAADTTSQSSSAGTRLADARLRACQNRQSAINNILSRLVTRGTNQLDLFNTIAQRVETFKTTKNVTVSNYDQLVATLQADQTKATSDLAAMKSNGTLDCTSSDPKGMVSAFQTDLKQEISDLKAYRTDVKNLIVAVKTAVGDASSSNGSTGGNQ